MRRRSESSQFPYRAQVLDRSFAILDVLAASTEDLSLADMGEKLNLHKSTFYRLLRTLEPVSYTHLLRLEGANSFLALFTRLSGTPLKGYLSGFG